MSRALLSIIINFSRSPRGFVDDRLGLLGDPLGRCHEDGIFHPRGLHVVFTIHNHVPLFARDFRVYQINGSLACFLN